MPCERCGRIQFRSLLAQRQKFGFYILHADRASYSRSLVERCALCTLISSQLGDVELDDDICGRLGAFMVLKRRWPSPGGDAIGAGSPQVDIHSRLGFGTLSTLDALPGMRCDQTPNDRIG